MIKKTIKKLHQVQPGEVFEYVHPLVPGIGGKCIRVFGTKYNVLCLNSFQVGMSDLGEEVRIIGKMNYSLFEESVNSRFDELFAAAVEGLVEYYEELEDASLVLEIKERIEDIDTGNDQNDYVSIKNLVENQVQNWIVDKRFI
jgi:hypothetical protein